MQRDELRTLAARFNRVMSETELNELGREVRFCRPERLPTPSRLALSLVGSFALRQVETIADLQRAFNALFETEVAYKPFHNQLAKSQFAEFTELSPCRPGCWPKLGSGRSSSSFAATSRARRCRPGGSRSPPRGRCATS
jgi:hypothetical protein